MKMEKNKSKIIETVICESIMDILLENENKIIAYYEWLNFYDKKCYRTKCEVLSYTKKTAKIKLLGFGPYNSPPGTIMPRVRLDKLHGFNPYPSDRRDWMTDYDNY